VRHGRLGGISRKLLTRVLFAGLVVAGLLIALASAGTAGTGGPHATNAADSGVTNAAASSVAGLRPTTGLSSGVLQATIAPDSALLHDGDGVATVSLADVSSTTVPLRNVDVKLRVPRPARVSGLDSSKGWNCTTGPRDAIECHPALAVVSSSSLGPINVDIKAARRSVGNARLTAHATWIQPGPKGQPVRQSSTAALMVHERAPLTVHASAAQKTVTDLVAGIPMTPDILQGTVGGRTPEPIRVRWRQLCGHGPCTPVQWTTPIEGLLVDGQQPEAAFKPPAVTRPELLKFALTATDPRGNESAITTVRVLPDQVAHLDPRLKSVTLAGAHLRANERPVTGLRLPKPDQANVSVGSSGAYQTQPNGLVSLTAHVAGERVTSVHWGVSLGPSSMLAGAHRRGATITFRAPALPGTYGVRMTATTVAGSFTRDELIVVRPGGTARAAAAAVDPKPESAFCKVEKEAREHEKISISLPAGGTFEANTNKPPGEDCSGTEEIKFHDGSTTLGSFKLADVAGTITEARGLVIDSGTLVTPAFWNAEPASALDSNVHVVHGGLATQAANEGGGEGLRIGFQIPRTEGISVGLGIPLGSDGFGDLAGWLNIDEKLLSKFPVASSLPSGWKMTGVSLSVLPEARRFELTATAKGPAKENNTGGEISLDGALTFDGQVSVTVTASNLAVFDSAGGEKATLTASGTLTLLPGQRLDPNKPDATGSFFPVVDVEVSAAIDNYKPAANVTLSGKVKWSSSGSLDVEGELVTKVKDNDIRTTVTGSYTDADNWKLYASLDAGEDGLSIGKPELLKLKTVEGELSRSAGKLDFSVKGEATDVHVFKNVDIKTAKVAFTSSCKFANEESGNQGSAADAGTLVCLKVESTFEVKLPGAKPDAPPLEVTGSGKLDFKTLKFEATGKLKPGTPFGPEALRLHDVQLSVTNAPPTAADCGTGAKEASANGVYFELEANATVLGLPLNVKGAYLGGDKPDYCLRATVAGASLPDGNSDELKKDAAPATAGCKLPSDPSLQDLTFDYASQTKVAHFTGKFCLPSAVRQKLGDVGTQQGTVDIKLSKDGFEGEASYTLAQTKWFLNARPDNTPDPTKAALGFRSLTVTVNATKTAGLNLGLNAGGEISLPAPTDSTGGAGAASRADVDLGVDVSLRPAPQLRFSVVIGGKKIDDKVPQPPCNERTAKLKDVFGAPGFNICQLGLSGSIGATGFSIGVNARFMLPASWGVKLGTQNASFAVGFNISASTPCLDLEIAKGNPNGGPAVDLLNKGAIKADLAALRIAPNGCELPGAGEIPAGIRLAFKGSMFGTATDVNLVIERQSAGIKINFTQHVDASSLGPLKFGPSDIRVLVDPANQHTVLGLKTSLAVGSGTFSFDGNFSRLGVTTTLDATTEMHAKWLAATFDGNARLHFETGPRDTKAAFSGQVNLNIVIMTIGIEINKLTYDSGHGGLQELDMKANTGFRLGSVQGQVGGSLTWARGNPQIGLGLKGHFNLWGFRASFDLPAKLTTNIRLPFEFGPGADTTTISEPGSLGVLRLKGKVDGNVDKDGRVAVVHVLPIQGCFPFETICVNIGDARVNTANGTVSFRALGRDWVIDASRYIKNTGEVNYAPGISRIANEQTGMCLDVAYARFENGNFLHQVPCATAKNDAQEFQLLRDGTLRVRSRNGTQKCVKGVAAGNSSELQLTDCNSTSDTGMQWYRDENGQIKGGYRNGNSFHTHLCLEPKSNDGGARFTLAGCVTSKENQHWVIDDTIYHRGPDGCLSVPGGDLTSELKLFNHCNGLENQAFALYPNGELKIRGLCVAASGVNDGATVKLAQCDGSGVQRWSLYFGEPCVGTNGGDRRQAYCMAPGAFEGAFAPIRLRQFDHNASNLKWDLTP
jgi:hypothetical protein